MKEQIKKRKKVKKTSDKKYYISLLAIIVASIVLAAVFWISISRENAIAEKLTGLWIYDSATSYEFKEKETGILYVEDREYKFVFKIKGETLRIDFENENVLDCQYKIWFENEMLYMEGEEGTSGGVYELAKKDI